jgi:diketogulonate reductase-like aldo/keto reductase
MLARSFGRTGVKLPVVGQGTWNMERDSARSAVRALERGIELGMTHIDTAEMYGGGEVERLVAQALRGRRERVFVASKLLPQNASRKGTLRACEQSLTRLGVEQLDLYLLHWPGQHPLEDTFAAFEELRKAGKIRFWGVSNFDDVELEAAVRIAGRGKIACNQVLYHLGQRAIEHRVLPACEKHGLALVGYSPFGSGDFPSARSRAGKVLSDVARARDATPRQVALAFLVRRAPLFTIPKASSSKHVEENAGGAELELDASDIAALEAAFPRGSSARGVPIL